jgi:N-acetyl-1-D-myo-inositol-2-amino-2-deoxy-alpha-D-glucopyranoside deacetylase/mycothiol S-conjugate amidase
LPSRRLLFSLAHPDDESFGSGGTIARYVNEGAEVYYVCATNGDVGTVSPEKLNGYKSVAELRLAELDAASKILGFKEVFKLGYRDSGMMNSDTSKDPASLWQAPREQVARRVVELIREVRPQVVVTFNKYGGYGHPDHIAIQRATTDAFNLAGDATYDTGQPAYQPQKLYYTGVSARMFRLLLPYMRLRGMDPRHLGKNKDIDFLAIMENIEPVHTRVPIAKYFDVWDKASACHASQLGGGAPRIPLVRQLLARSQGFTRVHPVPQYNRVDEYDLFAGVQLD